jgi:PilZ domain-containing protein
MGNRREPRQVIQVPVRIFGTDSNGRVFSERVTTVNLSQQGVEVSGIKAQVKMDEIVGIAQGANKGRFRVKWVGQAGTPQAGHLGLLNLQTEKPFWDIPLPGPARDGFQAAGRERRRHARMRCTISVELHPEGGSLIWGKASDLSIGGCYIEMQMPIPLGTRVKLGIWVGESKIWVNGKVTNSTPGFGFGLQFDKLSDNDVTLLVEFLRTVKKDE